MPSRRAIAVGPKPSCSRSRLISATSKRRRDGASADGRNDAEDLRPMGADEFHVDARGNHRLQRWIGGRLAEAIETPMLQVRDTGRKLQPGA
jgi:hypothetical protein